MLRLKLSTDNRWAELITNNLEEALTDHAYCEQKAATSAINIIVNYPEHTEMVNTLTDIAMEELEHFKKVHKIIIERGWKLGKARKDEYVRDLLLFAPNSSNRDINLVNKLLFSAMIEARSCERFRTLYLYLKDKDEALANFYHELEQSEANHYTVFLNFAKKYGENHIDVDKRWNEFLEYEANIISKYGNKGEIHG